MLSYLCQSKIGKFLPVKFVLKRILGILSKNQNWAYKGQLISKENCQAVNFSKKRTNELIFTTFRRNRSHQKDTSKLTVLKKCQFQVILILCI